MFCEYFGPIEETTLLREGYLSQAIKERFSQLS